MSIEKVKEYAAEDADITIQFYNKFKPLIIENQLEKLFYEIEMPLVKVLAKMEANGVKIDIEDDGRVCVAGQVDECILARG